MQYLVILLTPYKRKHNVRCFTFIKDVNIHHSAVTTYMILFNFEKKIDTACVLNCISYKHSNLEKNFQMPPLLPK